MMVSNAMYQIKVFARAPPQFNPVLETTAKLAFGCWFPFFFFLFFYNGNNLAGDIDERIFDNTNVHCYYEKTNSIFR